ncbi:delta-like protein C [Littorina saxatilis]|uniref:delta-like protein C n=1 Tax=Littorina saxatilis TaxID=31220 RepID=UPI0038B5BCB7
MNSNCAVSCGTCATLNPCFADPEPCQNGGTCTKDESDAQGYTCACPSGFLGHDCDVVNDPCDPNPCQNAGTCDDGVCDCTGTSFTGATCAETVCVDKYDSCNAWANEWSPSECETNPGYMNSNCAVSCGTCATLNPCFADPEPCQNGGTCTKDESDAQGYTCACPSGFLGHDCDVVNDPCDPNPCQNAGTCDDGVCDCTGTSFTGATCAG